jgi:CheY-like chemotaxis protein
MMPGMDGYAVLARVRTQLLAYLALITYVPEISLWLADLLYPPVPGGAVYD